MAQFPNRRRGRTVNKKLLGRAKVYFTVHADDRMKQRGVTEAEVFATVAHPEQAGLPTAPPKERVAKSRSNGDIVQVVYELLPSAVGIITVIVIRQRRARSRDSQSK
jgi:hypothetical protein